MTIIRAILAMRNILLAKMAQRDRDESAIERAILRVEF